MEELNTIEEVVEVAVVEPVKKGFNFKKAGVIGGIVLLGGLAYTFIKSRKKISEEQVETDTDENFEEGDFQEV